MTIIDNEKGFKVIKLNFNESRSLGWGTSQGMICCECNRILARKEPIYYIAALNDVMDEDCWREWYDESVHYTTNEDIEFENNNFSIVYKALN